MTDKYLKVISIFCQISGEFIGEATFTISRQKHLKLIFKGYQYTKRQIVGDVTYWRCARRQKCTGKAHTKNIDGREMVKPYDRHNHSPVID